MNDAAELIKRDIIRHANRKRNLMILLIIFVFVLLGGAGYGVYHILVNDKNTQAAVRSVVDATVKNASNAVAEATKPATVFDCVKDNIAIVKVDGSVGTGFIAEMDGKVYLFTNEHVIRSLSRPTATLIDGTEVKLGKFYLSTDRDLARYEVLGKLHAKPLQICLDTPNIGDVIIAYGNSNGNDVHTESRGVILGCGPHVLEVKADIVPGNSGGPVVDEKGRVLGVSSYLKKIEKDKDKEWVLQDTRYEGAVCRYALRFTSVTWKEYDLKEYFVIVEKMRKLAERQRNANREKANNSK